MVQFIKTGFIFLLVAVIMTSCTSKTIDPMGEITADPLVLSDAVEINLNDGEITVDGKNVTTDNSASVYIANDIIYYEDGKDFTYGEGSEEESHSKEEAEAHTVVHIGKPGKYSVSGKLTSGQIAVDLGEGAEENPEAVVILVLNGVDITCTVAPAVIFYNVYECGKSDKETATKDIDSRNAGANVIIADGTENNINGSFVAKIYKSYELSTDGTEIVDSKKLHKYDGAFYSKRTMNICGGEKGDGILNINAENEGLGSELHLTVNGGIINITSGNDGINTNEDNVSVTTINAGVLNIICDGSTGEGDGIDSNGWLVINGGTVNAQACATSGDAGIDSDKGIYINGGTVTATGNMLDTISGGNQNYAVFNFRDRQKENTEILLKSVGGETVFSHITENAYSILIISSPDLTEGGYNLFIDGKQTEGTAGGITGKPGGMRPDGFNEGESNTFEFPENGEFPEKPQRPAEEFASGEFPSGEFPSDFDKNAPDGFLPEGGAHPDLPENLTHPGDRGPGNSANGEISTVFPVKTGGNYFYGVAFAENR